MPIIKAVVTPSRVPVTYHKVHKAETAENFANAVIYVKSYVDQSPESQEFITWMWYVNFPLLSVTSLDPTALETLLIEETGSPFYGGQQVVAENTVQEP